MTDHNDILDRIVPVLREYGELVADMETVTPSHLVHKMGHALTEAHAEIVRLSALIPNPPRPQDTSDDERDALFRIIDHSVTSRDAADAIIASPVWRNRGRGPISEELIDRVAAAIAKTADADYWVDEIEEWENSEEWECEARSDDYPHTTYEDRAYYRMQARAALEAARDAEAAR